MLHSPRRVGAREIIRQFGDSEPILKHRNSTEFEGASLQLQQFKVDASGNRGVWSFRSDNTEAKIINLKKEDAVKQSYGTGVGTRRTVQEGGALDVTLLFAPFDEALKTGNVDKSTQTVVARVRLAIAVKPGAPKPDISNAAAVKKLLLNAKSIATVDPAQGSVGGAAMLAFDKMGITDQVKPKLKLYSGGGGVQKAVADGEVEVAMGPYLSDYRNPPSGLQLIGALPPDAATPVDITAWVSTNAPDKKAAMQLIDYFKGKEAASVWEEVHVFPATK
jgi:molybdate transport system substrate-binding protein